MDRKIAFADLKAQYNAYKNEIDAAVLGVMSSTQFIMGSEVEKLEQSLADYVGSKKAISVASGTDALLVALMAHGVGPGDEVITTPFTFIATAEVIALLGATPIFADIDEKTYNQDVKKTAALITPKTKVIMPVSLYGQTADMAEFAKLVKGTNILLIEDACQSFGATDNGQYSCNLHSVGCTSFFPSKPLGCYGDGGAVFANDEEYAEKVACLRNHGQTERYKHKYVGINGRLDAMQAAILNVKLKYMKDEVTKRTAIGTRYTELISKACCAEKVVTPYIAPGKVSVYAQYSIRVKNREEVTKRLNAVGVPTAVHYPIPLHMQECFAHLNVKKGALPISEKISTEIMSLPMSAFLTADDQNYVVEQLAKIISEI